MKYRVILTSQAQSDRDKAFRWYSDNFSAEFAIIHRTVQKKINSLKNAYRKDISNNWLLIHATRNPISSDIYPLFPQEIERLLGSEAGLLAKQSEYKRVILWDGVDGGYVDLKSDDFSAVEI